MILLIVNGRPAVAVEQSTHADAAEACLMRVAKFLGGETAQAKLVIERQDLPVIIGGGPLATERATAALMEVLTVSAHGGQAVRK